MTPSFFWLPLLFLLGYFCASTDSFAQSGWVPQASGTANDLWRVSFTDSSTGTAVGGNGTILRTTNGGVEWTLQSSGTMALLYGVSFVDANNGTVVGSGGTILHTTNGGTNWTSQTSGTVLDLYAVSFTSAGTGTAVGGLNADSAIVLRTTNGGTTWVRQDIPTTAPLWGVSMVDDSTGFAVGELFTLGGTILHTTDSGVHWVSQSAGIYTDWMFSVHFINRSTGMAAGLFATVIKTTDGGTTWTNLSVPYGHYQGVSMIDTNNALVVGAGMILRTTDGGASWTTQISQINASLDVCSTDRFHATAVGVHGSILHTTTGGIVSVRENSDLPKTFELFQNFPNPFNPGTSISYQIPTHSHVTLKISDMLGRVVAVLVDRVEEPGYRSANFIARGLSSGVYYYRLQAGSYSDTKKLLLMR